MRLHSLTPRLQGSDLQRAVDRYRSTLGFRLIRKEALWDAIKGRVKAEWGPEEMPCGMMEFAIKDRSAIC
jgi:hypothetical protein